MRQMISNPWISCLSELNILLVFCILSQSQVLALNQQQYAVPQQQKQVVVQQGVPQQQQDHSYQHGKQQFQCLCQCQVPQCQQQPQYGSNVLHDTQSIHDKQQLKEHLHGAIGSDDLNKMYDEKLQFLTKLLNRSRLIKSLVDVFFWCLFDVLIFSALYCAFFVLNSIQ